MKTTFAGKLAVVTGASSGIGAELAQLLAAEGARLVLVARRAERLRILKEKLSIATDFVTTIEADLGAESGAKRLIAELEKLPHPVDVMINNAGSGFTGGFSDQPWEKSLAMFRLNMLSLAELSHWAAGSMKKRGQGWILNVASTAAFQPIPNMAGYAATKSFVSSLSLAMHRELSASGVVVSCLMPGKTATEFFEAARMNNERFVKWAPSMTAAKVARLGLSALRRGRPFVIAGAGNKLVYLLGKISPLGIQVRAAEYIFRGA